MVTMNLSGIERVRQLVNLRTQELGETTSQSIKAIVISILKALRARTKVAKENKITLKTDDVTGQYLPSFYRQGAKTFPCFRDANGNRLLDDQFKGVKVIWTAKGIPTNSLRTFKIVDEISDNKKLTFIVVAPSSKSAIDVVKKRHKARVGKHKGLARLALGLAMKSISQNEQLKDDGSKSNSKIANENVNVNVMESGFNSGRVDILVEDNLDYAQLALKNGQASLDESIQSGMNKIVGMMKHKLKKSGMSLDESLRVVPMNDGLQED